MDYFTRPTQSDRTRQAHNGGEPLGPISRDADSWPSWAWFLVGAIGVALMIGGNL